MKHLLSILFIAQLFGCKSYQHLAKNDIKEVYMLYQYKKGINYAGKYELYDNSVIDWDKHNTQIKKALASHVKNMGKLEKRPVADMEKIIINKKTTSYKALKVTPLTEFGYLKMRDGSVVYYGIMGDDIFIDLSSNQVYY